MFIIDFYQNELNEKDALLLLVEAPYVDDQLKNLREFPEKAYRLMLEFKKITNPNFTNPEEIANAFKDLANLYEKLCFRNLYDSMSDLANCVSKISLSDFDKVVHAVNELDKLQQSYILKVQNFTMSYYRKTSFGAKEIYDFAFCDYALVKKTRSYSTEVQIINELIGLEKSGKLQLLQRYIQNEQFSDAYNFAQKENLLLNLLTLGLYSITQGMDQLKGTSDKKKQDGIKILLDACIHNLLYGIGHFRRLYKIP